MYTDEAKILTPVIAAANGVILDMKNDGSTWTLTIWIPERTDLAHCWEYACHVQPGGGRRVSALGAVLAGVRDNTIVRC